MQKIDKTNESNQKKKKKNHKQTDKKTGSPCGSGGPVSKEKKAKRILYHALGSILGQRLDPNLDKKCNSVHPYCPFPT